MSEIRHWSEDEYWTDALEQVHHLQEEGETQLVLDLDAISKVAFNGDGPAYKLMNAMVSVYEQEGEDGCKGAPRVMLALLIHLARISETRK